VHIKTVLNGSAAHHAGFAPGDEWLGVALTGKKPSAWRLQKLDDVLLYAGPAKKVTAFISRDRQLLQLPLTLPSAQAHSTWRLSIENTERVKRWLAL
jgi:predicted metalloprotease with PDZ domain